MRVAHPADHRTLLRQAGRKRHRRIDAVVVPTNRPAANLPSALELAAQLGSILVVLSSDSGPGPDDIVDMAGGRRDLRWQVLGVPASHSHPLLDLGTSRVLDDADNRHGQLGVKRSIGTLLGRLLDWRTMLFLDDDIFGLDARTVSDAARSLGDLAMVGFAVTDSSQKFVRNHHVPEDSAPDNSVVGHANRLGGGDQGVFVGGSALLVDLERPVPFFPTIYNEDWLFLFDALRAGKVGQANESIGQRPGGSPYADLHRARTEEFGEIVAEGLMDGLHRKVDPSEMQNPCYWAEFLERRQGFIAAASVRIEARVPAPADREPALAALAVAEERRREISAGRCATYVRKWRTDLATWHGRIGTLPHLSEFDDAAGYLGLSAPVEPLITVDGRSPA